MGVEFLPRVVGSRSVHLATRLFPFLEWFRGFTRETARADAVAGLTVALVLIPQSMAYAQLAGLPPYYGLYAAFLPPMVASLFGSSRQLATGPVAMVSLMTAATLAPLATAGSEQYVAYAILLALLVGAFQFALGVLRLGLIVNFISHPVVNGFTNAAALIIATSQLSKIFRVYVTSAEHHYETVYRVVAAAVAQVHWPTVGMAALAFAIMYGLRRLNPKVPYVLVAVVVTTTLSWATGFKHDRVVEIERVHSTAARQAVDQFNAAVSHKAGLDRLQKIKPTNTEDLQRLEPSLLGTCVDCHRRHQTGPQLLEGVSQEKMGLLHMRMLVQNRGLYEAHLVTASSSIQEQRSALRQLQFRAVRRDDGQLDFYEPGAVPEGRAASSGNWILSVGGKPIDARAILMMGGGAVVGEIPPGLPTLRLPYLDFGVLGHLFLMSMIISLLGFVEAISIAKAMAVRTHQRLDPNQELIGQGLGNMLGCLAQSYPVSGSFSRSAVNLQAGARTGLSNVVCSIIVCFVLLFFTPALYHLPQPVLAAVIMMAVVGLLDVKGFLHAWRAKRFDGLILLITFVSTLVFAPHLEWGIGIGVALSVGRYLHQTMQPPVVDLSLHKDGSLRDAKRHGLRRCRHVAAVRFDGPLNFTNVSYLEDKVMERVADLPDLKHVLIVAHGVNDIDASGEEILDKLVRRLRTSGYEVSFSGLKDEVLDVLHRTGLYATIGEQNVFPTQAAAIQRIHARTHRNTTEDRCPLLEVVPKTGDLATDAP